MVEKSTRSRIADVLLVPLFDAFEKGERLIPAG